MKDSPNQLIAFQSRDLILFRHQSCTYVEHLFECEICCVRYGLTIVQVIFPMNTLLIPLFVTVMNILQNHRMFLSIFCNIWNSVLFFPHLIIHPIHEWSWFYWQFQFCFIVSDDELRPCCSLRIDIVSHRPFTKYYLIHNGLRGSIMMSFLVGETKSNFSCRSPRTYIGSLRSLVHLTSLFHSWEDQAWSSSHFWVACWRETFHKLLTINSSRKPSFGQCRYQVSLIAPLSQQVYSRVQDF